MSIVGALITGFIAGIIARVVTPGDFFRHMSGPMSWLVSMLVGLGGALIGYLIFHVLLGWGDENIFDFGGIVGAVIGAIILLLILGFIMRRRSGKAAA